MKQFSQFYPRGKLMKISPVQVIFTFHDLRTIPYILPLFSPDIPGFSSLLV